MALIGSLFTGGAMPTLERLLQFTQARHKTLAHSIANIDTPYFKPVDLNPERFQNVLSDAIERRRRESVNPMRGRLQLRDTNQIRWDADNIRVRPEAGNEGMLYHDQNNRDLERMMQHLAENTLAHNTGVELIRNQFRMLETAIRERIS